MHTYRLSIPLDSNLQHQFYSHLCYGLPSVHWEEEENLSIVLSYFDQLNDSLRFELQDRLAAIVFAPFSLCLKGVRYTSSRKGEGVIWVEMRPEEPVIKLKRKIDQQLQGLDVNSSGKSFQPQIILGKFENLHPDRLIDYLTYHFLEGSSKVEVTRFVLSAMHSTSKRVFYTPVQEYPLVNAC